MKIRKIAFSSDGTILIDFDQPNPSNRSETDILSLKTKDAPRPEFKKALDGLLVHVLHILELSDKYGESMKMTGVSLSVKGDVTYAILKAKKLLTYSNSPFNIITPKKPTSAGEESAGDDLLTDECVKSLDLLIEEAKRFIRGERQQGELKLISSDEEDEEEDDDDSEEEEDDTAE
jgi:hypothetical protein